MEAAEEAPAEVAAPTPKPKGTGPVTVGRSLEVSSFPMHPCACMRWAWHQEAHAAMGSR